MATTTKQRTRSAVRPTIPHRSGQDQGAGNALRDLRRRYGLSQALLARLLDVSLRTLSGAESAASIPPRMRRSATQAVRLCDALAEAMQRAFVGQWLDQPNEMLGKLKPVEAIERGQLDLVWQVVQGLRSGSQL